MIRALNKLLMLPLCSSSRGGYEMNIISIIQLKKKANNLKKYAEMLKYHGESLVPFNNSI